MLSFSRQTDYALIALAHLAGLPGEVASARQIAESYNLSVSLVMKILKVLQHAGIVTSVRGVRGGYQLGIDLHAASLHDLIDSLKGLEINDTADEATRLFRSQAGLPTEPPLLAVHSKLMRFLKDVKLSDLVLPGRRIDVPVEMIGMQNKAKCAVPLLAVS